MQTLSKIAAMEFHNINLNNIQKLESALGQEMGALNAHANSLYGEWSSSHSPDTIEELLRLAEFASTFDDARFYSLAPVVWANRQKLAITDWLWSNYDGQTLQRNYDYYMKELGQDSESIYLGAMRLFFEHPFPKFDTYLYGLSLYPRAKEMGIDVAVYVRQLHRTGMDEEIDQYTESIAADYNKKHGVATDFNRFVAQAQGLHILPEEARVIYGHTSHHNKEAYAALAQLKSFMSFFPEADLSALVPLLREYVQDPEGSKLPLVNSMLKKIYVPGMDSGIIIEKMKSHFTFHLEDGLKTYSTLMRETTPTLATRIFADLRFPVNEKLIGEIVGFRSHAGLEQAFEEYLGLVGSDREYPYEGEPLRNEELETYSKINRLAVQGFVWNAPKLGILFSEPGTVYHLNDAALKSYISSIENGLALAR